MSLNKYLQDDVVIEIDLTPNRGDCLSVLGIAREVSALFHVPLTSIVLQPQESNEPIESYITVTVKDPERCPRYIGRLVRGVTIKESPLWIKRRLFNLGIRPISNVVDITNYILLLFGQPMHSFDYASIKGKEIHVDRARLGQKFVTLDGVERLLDTEDLLINDGEQPTAIAGVMGGAGSGISDNTVDVFLEGAYFDPVGIRKTSKKLDLCTDASYRFERGVDPGDGCRGAIDTAAEMIRRYAGGHVAKNVIDVYPHPIKPKKIPLIPSHVSRLLGVSLGTDTIKSILDSIQITFISEEKKRLFFQSPIFRHDLNQEVDLIEEIGRLYGYDNIPSIMNATIALDQKTNSLEKINNTIRHTLAAKGLHETVTHSMTSDKNCSNLRPDRKPILLLNPLNPDMSCMRTTLLGSLLEVTTYNNNRKNHHNRFFEIGKTMFKNNTSPLPTELDVVAILIEGDFIPSSWNNEKKPTDFYVLKHMVISLGQCLGIQKFTFKPIDPIQDTFFTIESAECFGLGVRGNFGKIKQEITTQYSIKTPVYYAEMDITEYLRSPIEDRTFASLPRFPAIERDFCFVMKDGMLASVITEEIYSCSGLIKYVQPFDMYQGDALGPGLKSITYSVHFQSDDRTLTDKSVKGICTTIISQMKSKYGVELRR